ncbi:DUF3783 domain-containing protein [Hungatella sp.]|uniref:DUF3783 domain-containing protein n=1 Tax=Hungatella sp. TaxID=2613924 RepID=UPI0039924073
MAAKEMVLYYQPEREKEAGNASKAAKLKGVLIRMGIRIKNITPEQTGQTVGYLAGFEGFDERETEEGTVLPELEEEMLVMKNFTNRRIDELLAGLRRAGVPKVELKAVVTETNCGWTFYSLYEELKKEREAMTKKDEA